jgi:hypothetical protein
MYAKIYFCYFGVYFALQNVQLCKNGFDAEMDLMPCKNVFLQSTATMRLKDDCSKNAFLQP